MLNVLPVHNELGKAVDFEGSLTLILNAMSLSM